jgi:hypothetical protein
MTKPDLNDSRRSARVPLKLLISLEDSTHRTCEAETEIVNLHGALINAAIELPYGAEISIHVYLTGKYAKARVVFINFLNRRQCGVELEQPENIWGVSLPPDDWSESSASRARQ